MFRVLGILTFQWNTGPSPRRMPFPPQHLAHVLEKEKEPKTKMFEDDEWILSLTRADATIADIPEWQLTSAASNGAAQDQDVYLSPKRCDPFKLENSCESMCQDGSWRSVKEKSRHS